MWIFMRKGGAFVNDLLGAALCCPLCGEALAVCGNSLVCAGARRHTYDMARAGYVNLNTHLPQSGDTAEMAAARQAFLRRGYYAPLADALARSPSRARAQSAQALRKGCSTQRRASMPCRSGTTHATV